MITKICLSLSVAEALMIQSLKTRALISTWNFSPGSVQKHHGIIY